MSNPIKLQNISEKLKCYRCFTYLRKSFYIIDDIKQKISSFFFQSNELIKGRYKISLVIFNNGSTIFNARSNVDRAKNTHMILPMLFIIYCFCI